MIKMETLGITNRNVRVDIAVGNDQQLQLVPSEMQKFDLPVRKKRFLFFFKRDLPPQGTFQFSISVTCPNLTLSGNPLLCEMKGEEPKVSGEFDVESHELPFKLFFNPAAVVDCKEGLSEERQYQLDFTLTISDPNRSDRVVFETKDYLTVIIRQFSPKLKFIFLPEQASKNLQYSVAADKSITRIGKLRICHNGILGVKCIPDITNREFQLFTAEPNSKDQRRVFSIFTMPMSVSIEDKIVVKGLSKALVNLKSGESVEIPIDWNMGEVVNPEKQGIPDSYVLMAECDGEEPSSVYTQKLNRNSMLTRLKATVSMQQLNRTPIEYDITNSGVPGLDLGTLLLMDNQTAAITMKFENTADSIDTKHPDAAVLLWGMKLSNVVPLKNGKGIRMSGNKTLRDLFALNVTGDQYWALSPRAGREKACEISIIIDGNSLCEILPLPEERETYADIQLTIDYYVKNDYTGDDHQKMKEGIMPADGTGQCQQTMQIRLKRTVQPEWLCVDFGTSAVVAAYAQSLLHENNALINLKEQKRYILGEAHHHDKNKISVDDEKENLISSKIFFNETAAENRDFMEITEEAADYGEYTIWFSPSVNAANQDYQLPCLKTIMGYDHLPNIFIETVKNLKYWQKTNGKMEEKKLFDEDNRPTMTVNMVAQVIYRQLFYHYLKNRMGRDGKSQEHRKVNKLVLSVPNTFTPLNIAAVQSLARETMPEVNPEYLYTVSESDAVACYYLVREREFLDNSKENDEERQRLDKKESVLVYDMGAGTLDLTWFIKECDTMGNTTMTVKGRMGLNKAGDYLDYVLATILMKLYEESIQKAGKKEDDLLTILHDVLLLDSTGIRVASKHRKALKDFVKKLKIQLDKKGLIIDNIGGGLELDGNPLSLPECKTDDILKHDDFQKFLSDITESVLTNFADRFGTDGKLDIDVLVFSGRSTSMRVIRQAVSKRIATVLDDRHKLLFADICSRRLARDIEIQNNDNSQLKTVVTYGALAYANFQREGDNFTIIEEPFYATYGIVLRSAQSGNKWIPLLGRDATDMRDLGNGVFESKQVEIPAHTDMIDLIQSYSADVEGDYERKDFEMISKLSELNYETGLAISLRWNGAQDTQGKGNVLTLKRNLQDVYGIPMNPHDDFENDTLRKSLWPLTFVKQDNSFR